MKDKPAIGSIITVTLARRWYPVIDGTPYETEEARFVVTRHENTPRLDCFIDAIRLFPDGTTDRPVYLHWPTLTAKEPTDGK